VDEIMQAFTWQCGKFKFEQSTPLIMGILNVTPDSFSDGGSYTGVNQAVARANEMIAQGAQIIDVGGESTRPGSDEVSISEELSRVLPVVRLLSKAGICVSLDSRHPEVVATCLHEGVAVINDITGFTNPEMLNLAVNSDAGCIIMHMLGKPKSMQVNPEYNDVVADIENFLLKQAKTLENHGVAHQRICLDPGPGFGKNYEQSVELLKASDRFASLGNPPYVSMAAWSRKRFLGQVTGIEIARDRVAASVTAAAYAASLGATVLRVHDVDQTVQALKVLEVLW
jgi:dihydropteroate synthase